MCKAFGGGVGGSRVLRWSGGKKAAFLLMFDDNAPTMVTHVIPELVGRGMAGTFYINPGNPPFAQHCGFWEHPAPGIEYANHTHTHVGAWDADQLDEEIRRCQEVIFRCYPERPVPRLVSFGRPGGVPWTVDPAAEADVLARHHLIERPPYKGYPFQFSSNEQILSLVDSALEGGGMGYVAYHGVGGDWHPVPREWFVALLDKLDEHRDEIWITDPISWHRYERERDGARVEVRGVSAERIELRLGVAADPAFYDLPLTLETCVPDDWRACEVRTGGQTAEVRAGSGSVRFDARAGEIVLVRKG